MRELQHETNIDYNLGPTRILLFIQLLGPQNSKTVLFKPIIKEKLEFVLTTTEILALSMRKYFLGPSELAKQYPSTRKQQPNNQLIDHKSKRKHVSNTSGFPSTNKYL